MGADSSAAPDRLLTAEQLAAQLQVSVRTIRTWSYERRIPSITVGSRVRFRQRDVDAYLDARTKTVAAS